MKRWSWDLGCYCDYKCDYCFFTQAGWDNMLKLQGGARTPADIAKAWERVAERYGRSEIFITGGEPFLYPGFSEIASLLGRSHKIHITSNLSQPLDAFIAGNSPDSVELNSTYHPLHADIVEFIDQVLKLKRSGFKCDVCYLAHPLQLREMTGYKKYFHDHGIRMEITLFWGKYNGVDYPSGYSRAERAVLDYACKWPQEKPSAWADAGGQDGGERVAFEERETATEGLPCGAGRDYANIGVDGSVRVCGQIETPLLGNIFENNVRLLEHPYLCTSRRCRSREYTQI